MCLDHFERAGKGLRKGTRSSKTWQEWWRVRVVLCAREVPKGHGWTDPEPSTEPDPRKGLSKSSGDIWIHGIILGFQEDGNRWLYPRKRKISVFAQEKNKQFRLIQIHFHASLPKKHAELLKSTGASWQNNFSDHYQMPLFRTAQKFVLAHSNIYETPLCHNEGLRKWRSEARLVPSRSESVVVGKAAVPLSWGETCFPDR